MKKIIISIILIVVVALITIFTFGIQIGNVRIGSQNDTLETKQVFDIQKSDFAINHLQTDKIICVNLWATWCGPCIKEIPMLNRIKEEYAPKNIEFLSLSVDTDSIKLKEFLKTDKFDFKDITFENLKYRTAILNYLAERLIDYKITQYAVPMTYIIKNNKVVKELGGGLGEGELEMELDRILR